MLGFCNHSWMQLSHVVCGCHGSNADEQRVFVCERCGKKMVMKERRKFDGWII